MNPWIEVDGGVSPANAYKVIDAGANALVPFSVFNSPDYAAHILGIKASEAANLHNVIDYIYTYYCNYLYIKQLYTYGKNGSTVTMVGYLQKYVFLDGEKEKNEGVNSHTNFQHL